MEWIIFFIILWFFSTISNSNDSKSPKKSSEELSYTDTHEILKKFNKIEDSIPITNTEIPLNSNDEILKKYNIKFIYHITHINNLKNILQYGLLSHNNNFVNNKIDNPEVNNRRNFIEPVFNRNVHNYVPFYFNPRNAMLYVNKENQENLVILAFKPSLIYKEGSLFTDGNASANNTTFYKNINDLNKLNWKCIKSKYWNDFEDGKRLMMAEVLVPNKVDTKSLKKIFCINNHIKNHIDNLVRNYPDIEVQVNTKLFF